jgi:hypothetical protein
MLFLNIHKHGEMIVTIFWGLWLLPLGLLALKSGFIPKFFGMLLIIACFFHLMNFFAFFFYSDYTEAIDSIFSIAAFGEIVFFLWLLIKGVKGPNPKIHKPEQA